MSKDGLALIETKWKSDKPYYKFMCTSCGSEATNSYCEPTYSQMMNLRLCFLCNFWREKEIEYGREHSKMTIINGHVYGPGNRTSGNFRGMAGRRFDIEYIEPSIYAGQRVTTFDLWSGSEIPEQMRALLPDTARFINGAEKVTYPKGALYEAAWGGSETKDKPYQLPSSLRPNAERSKVKS